MTRLSLAAASLAVLTQATAQDGDWRAFRGTDGTASSAAAAPRRWSAAQNIAWRTELPGPGTSSPIVVGDAVYLTCWSGYGLDRDAPGDVANLRRHLLRVDRDSGEIVWTRSIEPVASEDPFGGRMATHGYASSTPVSDGERVYVFFGKSGVFAFDPAGEQVWQTSVGTGSSQWLTGSGSSPTLWNDLLFVNASDESHALWALDKATGVEVWRRATDALDQAYGTPMVTRGDEPVVTLALLGAIWGLAPRTGEFVWNAETVTNGALAPTIVLDAATLYSFGGQTRLRSHAFGLGGRGDISATHLRWKSREGCYVTTPLLHHGHLYWVNEGGLVYCARASDGELVYKERFDGNFYASPIRAGDCLYYVSREGGTFVLPAKPAFEVLAHNAIAGDDSTFDATPAAGAGSLYLRSRAALYRITATAK